MLVKKIFLLAILLAVMQACDSRLVPLAAAPNLLPDGGANPDARVDGGGPECLQASDCDAGEVCHRSGECREPVCGEPLASAGTVLIGGWCSGAEPCVAGAVCVRFRNSLNLATKEYDDTTYQGAGYMRCEKACDPCSPNSCPDGFSCIQREAGPGGFCHYGSLGDEGSACAESPTKFCISGLICGGTTQGIGCARPCVPADLPSDPVLAGAFPGGSSPDCRVGETCSDNRFSISFIQDSFEIWTCHERGEIETGYPCVAIRSCSGYPQGGEVCSFDTFTCTEPDCGAGCPTGTECVATTGQNSGCVADGVSDYLGFCASDRQCKPGLTCQDNDPPTTRACRP